MSAIADTDLKRFRSSHTISGIDCLGGPITTPNVEITGSLLHELWDRVSETQGTSGSTEFRCFYLKNDNDIHSLKNPILVIKNQAKSPNVQISIGWGTAPVNDATGEQTIPNEFTFPTNVSFKEGDVPNKGAILGRDIPPNGRKAVWIRRQVFFGAAPKADDGYEVRLYTDNVKSEISEEPDNVPSPDEKASFIIGCNFTQRVRRHKVKAPVKSVAITQAGGVVAVAVAGSGFASTKATGTQAGASVTLNDSTDILMAMKQMNANTMIFCNALDGADGHRFDPEQFYKMLGREMSDQSHICFGRDDAITWAVKRHWMNRQRLRRNRRNDKDPEVCYYSKNRQNVHWLFLDTSGKSSEWDETSDQYAFVQSDLQRANANPTVDWIFVCSYRTGYGTQTDDSPRFLSASLRDTYHQLFQDLGVHIVFTHYFHNYQRLHCIKYNAASPDQPTPVHGDQEPDYIIPAGQKGFGDGCIWVNVGPCGRDLEGFVTPSATYMVIGDVSTGYLYGYLDNESKKLTCKYKTKSHEVIDTFTISKTE